MGSPKIFISYSTKDPDAGIAREFNQGLKQAGFTTFLAELNIVIGEEWAETIEREISSFDYFLIFLSENSRRSDMVVEEIKRAKRYYDSQPKDQKPGIIPIRIGIEMNEGINYDIEGYLSKFQQRVWKEEKHTRQYLDEIIIKIKEKSHTLLSDDEIKNLPAQNYNAEIPTPVAPLEIPGGVAKLDSRYYIERNGEAGFVNNVLQDGALLRIFAPRQYGKTSLLSRIIDHAAKNNHYVVALSFQLLDSPQVESLEPLLKVICLETADKLNLTSDEVGSRFKEVWDQDLYGAKRKCDKFFEFLLNKTDKPIVLAFDEVDLVFKHPEVSVEFFSLLRTWNEKSKMAADSVFRKLKMVVTYSSEVFLAIPDIAQSPFNIGNEKELREFTEEEVSKLITLHAINFDAAKKQKLIELIGGHPYLVRKALYQVASDLFTIEDILDKGFQDGGAFHDHLERHFWNLSRKENFTGALKTIIETSRYTSNQDICIRLRAAGLIKGNYPTVCIKNKLYEKYFRDKLQID